MSLQDRGKLSTSSRPDQVGWWFRIGRRAFDKVPLIPSLNEYQRLWIAWWTALQPEWRVAGSWPFPQSSSADDPWEDLLIGGKDGLFVVVMTLAWWSIKFADADGDPSHLEAAISDVSWVLSNLISVLTTEDSAPSPVEPLPSERRFQTIPKVGRPNKRHRLPQS